MPKARPPFHPVLVRLDCTLLQRIEAYRADQFEARGQIIDRVTAIHELLDAGLQRKARRRGKKLKL